MVFRLHCRNQKAKSKKLFIFALLLSFASTAFSQVRMFPAERQQVHSSKPDPGSNSGARIKSDEPLQLPFWDDFSKATGLYPDTTKWTDSYSVWINDGMAVNQPTIKVATFDGLDRFGIAYNPTEILVTGYADSLISKEIDLSETSLSAAERAGVYLSFFYQWQGNGEAPDRDDYLELEFKNDTSGWESIVKILPLDDFERTVFYDTILPVSGDRFFHEHFQFRFRSFGRQSGPYDTWNVDYVYLNKSRGPSDTSFPDRAAATQLTSMFGEYTAIPYRHFLENKTIIPMTFEVQNLKDSISSVNFGVEATFTNYSDSIATEYTTQLISETAGFGIGKNEDGTRVGKMEPLERVTGIYDTFLPDPDDPAQFNPAADSVDVDLKLLIVSDDQKDTARFRFQPIDLRINDTISRSFRLHDYYAYDDGVAEFSAGLIESGNLIAYQFELATIQPDTLVGFDIHFAPYAVTNNQTITFYIYHDDDGKPGKVWETIASQRIQRKAKNEFQTIKWIPAILINEPRFYIGWKQPVSGKALVGLDIDNDTGDKIFVNTTTTWYQNQVIKGSLMIRPIFGSGEVDTTVGTEDDLTFAVYPNPNTGSFYVDGKYDALRILGVTGSEVDYSAQHVDNRTYIELTKPSGLYILQFVKDNVIRTQKIVITR
jgi:hypothetical protein